MKRLISVLMILLLNGCLTLGEVSEIDPKTGYFPSEAKANVIKNQKYDIDKMKSLILVTDGPFFQGQVQNIKFFDHVINENDLLAIIVRENLQSKVSPVINAVAINQVYENYRPFLWLRYNTRVEGKKVYGQIILSDPKNMNDLFIAERYFDKSRSDQALWYPLFNSLIDYIRENSKTYR